MYKKKVFLIFFCIYMAKEKIELTSEDKVFAQEMAKLKQVPVDEILFNLSDPTLRPSYLSKSLKEISRTLELALNANKAHMWVIASSNANKHFNIEKRKNIVEEDEDYDTFGCWLTPWD